MMVKKTIAEILKNQVITNQFDFIGSCPDKDGVTQSFTIFDTEYFLDEVMHNFFDRLAFVTEFTSFQDFCSRFRKWATNRGPLYAHMAYGYSLGYNPIENYSSVESHTGYDQLVNGKKITHTWNQDKLTHEYDANDPLTVQREYDSLNPLTQAREYDPLDPLTQAREYDSQNPLKLETGHTNDRETTTYNSVLDTQTHNKYGVNSDNPVPVSTDTDTKTGSETVDYSGTRSETTTGKYSDKTTGKYSDTHSGGYDDTNSGTDKTEYNSVITKNGNIGVQTAAEMLEREFANLKNNLALRALWDFMDKCTFYSEGVDDLW